MLGFHGRNTREKAQPTQSPERSMRSRNA